MLVLKKQQTIVLGLAVLVAAAGFLNWSFGGREGMVNDREASDSRVGEVQLVSVEPIQNDFFTQIRLDREINRSRSVETLNSLISNSESAPEAKQEAERDIGNIAKVTELESASESLIKAKGFKDAVIYITNGKVNAMIKADALSSQDVTKIQEIITGLTGIGAEDIKVVEVK